MKKIYKKNKLIFRDVTDTLRRDISGFALFVFNFDGYLAPASAGKK